MKYCPKCNKLSFDYDSRFGANRCFSLDCLLIDYKDEFKGGLSEKAKKEDSESKFQFPLFAKNHC